MINLVKYIKRNKDVVKEFSYQGVKTYHNMEDMNVGRFAEINKVEIYYLLF